jgi:hypothetical protein
LDEEEEEEVEAEEEEEREAAALVTRPPLPPLLETLAMDGANDAKGAEAGSAPAKLIFLKLFALGQPTQAAAASGHANMAPTIALVYHVSASPSRVPPGTARDTARERAMRPPLSLVEVFLVKNRCHVIDSGIRM